MVWVGMAEESPPTVKAYCPNCKDTRTCVVHGEVTKNWSHHDEESGDTMGGGSEHMLLECRGCEFVFYQDKHWTDDDLIQRRNSAGETEYDFRKTVRTFPKLGRTGKPAWVDTLVGVDMTLHTILEQMYMAHEGHARILTAIALRTALDRATEVLGIEAAITFEEKLDALMVGGWIGETERNVLGVVTDAGNAAAHRGWEPNAGEVKHLVLALETFLQRAFVVGQDALKIRDRLPARQKRRRKPDRDSESPTSPTGGAGD